MADKLTELFRRHQRAGFLCTCGHRGDHAEHLTKVVRGHLRTRPVAWAGPPSDALERKAQFKPKPPVDIGKNKTAAPMPVGHRSILEQIQTWWSR